MTFRRHRALFRHSNFHLGSNLGREEVRSRRRSFLFDRRRLSIESLEDRRLLTSNPLLVDLSGATQASAILVALDASGTNLQITVNGSLVQNTALSGVSQLSVLGSSHDDTLTVDSTNGDPIPAGGLDFDGDPAGLAAGENNTLVLQGGSYASDTYTPIGQHAGTITLDSSTISFANITPVKDNVPAATATVNGTNANNAITYTQGPGGGIFVGNTGLVAVDNQETYEFNNKTNLVINTGLGTDTVNLNNPTKPAGLSGITVNGGNSSAGDTLTVNGTTGSDSINFAPTSPTSATIKGAGPVAIAANGIGQTVIDGQGGDDALSVTSPDVSEIGFTPGANVDSGSVTMQSLLAAGSYMPVSFSNLGTFASLAFADASNMRVDGLDVYGTSANNQFNLSTGGVVQIVNPANLVPLTMPIATPGVAGLHLIGQGGNNTFNVPGNHLFTSGIDVQGNPGGSNTVNFTGDGTAPVTVDLVADTVDETGFAPVSLSSINTLNVDAGGAALTVVGSGNDNMSYTPTASGAGTVAQSGAGPVINFTNQSSTFTLDPGTGTNSVTINGTAGDDTIQLLSNNIPGDTQVNVNSLQPVQVVTADTQNLMVNGGTGNDVVEVFSTFTPVTIPITDVGGPGTDALFLTSGGPNGLAATSDVYTPGAQLGSGTDTLAFATGTEVVHFANLAPVFDLVPGPLTVNGTNASNALNYSEGFNNLANFVAGTPSSTWGQVTVDSYEPIEFINKTALTINGLAGSDTFNVNNSNTPTSLTTITINGGDPTASDTLIVNGRVNAADAFTYTPATTTSDTGSVSDTGLPTVNFTGLEHLAINGQNSGPTGAGDDSLTVNTSNLSSGQTEILTPGTTFDSGHVDFRDRPGGVNPTAVPLDFKALGVHGSLSFNDTGRFDNLIYNGTPLNDNFSVTATGAVTLNDQIPVSTSSIITLTLAGLGGNDTFNIPGNHNLPSGIVIEGSEPASNILDFTGNGTGAVTVDLAAQTVTEAGFAPVSFTGVATVNVNAGGNTLAVKGTAGNDNLTYTPTGAAAGTVTLAGTSTVLNVSNVSAAAGAFTIDALGGTDTVTVNGTSAADVINLVKGATTTVQINGFLTANLPSASDENVVVAAGNGADTINVSGTNTTQILDIQGGEPGAIDPAVSDQLNVTVATAGVTDINEGATPDSGTVFNPDGNINFTGLEVLNITNTAAGNNTIQAEGTDGNDNITLSNDAQVVGGNEYYINNAAVILFTNFQTANISGNFGDDTIKVAPFDLFGVTSVNITGSLTSVDSLTVFGVNNPANVVSYNPAGSPGDPSPNVAITGEPVVNFDTSDAAVAHVTYQGAGVSDLLTVNVPAGSTTTYTAGNTPDAGSVQTGSLVPFSFANLGNGGQAVSVAAAGPASLVDNGTNANDAFTVTGVTGPARGQVQLNNDLPVQTNANVTSLTLNGLAGDNTYTVTATAANPLPYTTINVNGSGTPDPDVLTLNGDGTAVTANLGTATPSVTGGGLGTVNISGVGTVNLNAGGNVTVTGTAGNDTFAVTPTSATSATVQAYTGGTAQNAQGGTLATLASVGPVFNATNVSGAAGGFTINGNGGGDMLFVEGTQNADTVDVNDATSGANAVLIAGLLAVNYNAALPQVEVDSLAGSDTINIAPSTTTSFLVDGGDPIGVLPGDTINLLHPPGPYQIFPGPTKDSGGLKTPGFQTVSWVHIETVVNTGGGAPIITGTNGNDEITVIARDSSYNPANPGVPNPLLDGVQDFTVSVNDGPDMLFVNTPNLFIDALSGNDDIVVREPAPNQAVWNVQVYVAGGPPASGANRLGDNVELETPGTQSVTYTPNNPLAAVPPVPGAVFSSPNAGGGQFNDTGNISTVTATEFLIPGFYQSSPGGAENFVYAGEAGNDTLTYNTPANANAGSNLVYTPGATADAGTITGSQIAGAALTPLTFSGLGGTGSVSFTTSNAGRTDHLNVEGVPTSAGESFSVTPAGGGTVQLSQLPPASGIITLPILTASVNSLELDGLGGSDQFNLAGELPYTNAIIDDGSIVNLNGATGPVTITEGDSTVPSNTTISGYGGLVTLIGIDTANVSAGGNTLTATGTSQNDNIVYTPIGATSGTFYDNIGSGNNLVPNTVFNITNVAGNFMVFNDPGGNADQVTLRATAARDLIEINQGTGVAQVLANNVTALLPVELGISAEVLNVLGLGGQNTFQVIPAPGIAGQAQDNLLINLDGGASGAFSALVVGSSFGSAPGQLAANQFVFDNKNPTANSGTVRVFTAAVADPDINYTNIQTLSANVAGTSLNPNLLIMGPDLNEPNDQQGNASFLGSGGTINVQNATLFASSSEFPGQPADQDYYRVVAQTTGTLDFQVYFRTFNPALLPGGGELDLQVLDAAGNVIASAPGVFGADPGTGNARIRIPAVAGQSYFLNVLGATTAVVNGYNMTVINTAPPTPFNLELSRSVPAADAGSPDTGDLPPNAPADDTGRSQLDDVTNDNTPRIYLRLSDGIFLNDLPGNGTPDAPPAGVIPIPFSPNAATPGFRVAIFDGNNTQTPVGFASQVAGFPGLYEFDFSTVLADGVHHITAEVQIVDPAVATETGFGAASASLDLTIDTAPPPVAFGSAGVANSGLDGTSDSGVNGQPTTIVDRITNVSTPTFYGVAEANSIVRIYDDLNGDGVVDAGDVFLGQVTAIPIDGTNADPTGQWRITSNVDLNNPKLGFPLDGVRNILVTAEDLAGNVSPAQKLTIFVDMQGPTVNGINGTGNPTFPLFDTKLTPTTTPSPTPLINSLDVNFGDLPIRVGPDFVYPAVNPTEAETTSNYVLVGEHTGVIPITSVTFVDTTAAGTPGMSVATLHFAPQFTPLPDDRYTLTISDKITDNAGNLLDGEFNGTSFPTGQPSGNTNVGGIFVGSFTVNSRPEVGVYSSGTVELDINGNGVFDPQNPDATNRDAVVTMGYPTDRLFDGQFSSTYTTGAAPVVNGFDKLAAYGMVNGQWRWLYDLSGVSSGPPTSVAEPFAIDGLPVAGNFDGSPLVTTPNRPPVAKDGAQVGLFDGTAWYLDVLNQGFISAADIAAPATATHPAGKLVSDMAGLPVVGDFDGDGHVDLATYQKGVWEFDLSSLDPGHIVTGQWNAKLDMNQLMPASIPFNSTLARPLAADMDADGVTDIGLYLPGRTDTDPGTAQWYFLESNSGKTAPNAMSALTTLSPLPAGSPFLDLVHQFQDPTLGGHDLALQLGDQFALPLVGTFDPPPTVTSSGGAQTDPTANTPNWISNLYMQILGREPTTTDISNWTSQINQGLSPTAVAQSFVDSTERLSTIITGYYQQYLGRTPDQAGLNYWMGVWRSNGGPEQVQAGMISSPEYYATASKLYPNLSPDAAWVTALYHNLLNRDVDPNGLSYWVGALQTTSRAGIVLGFVTSDEYRASLINSWFETYLNRPADAASVQSLVQMMQAGMTQDALLTTVLSSDEYRNLS